MDKNQRPSLFKRLLAIIVDFLVLGFLGFISGLFLEEFYVSLGAYGTLIGTVVVTLYYGIMHSSLVKGQSIGKMAIGAKVIGLDGSYLPLNKSFLRAFVYSFPFMNLSMFSQHYWMIIGFILSMACFSSIYLMLVNKSRRCLHDILIGSVVVNESVEQVVMNESNDHSNRKLIPVGVVAGLMMLAGIYFASNLGTDTFSKLLAMKSKIESAPGVVAVTGINWNTVTNYNLNESRNTVSVNVRISDKAEASDLDSHYFDEINKMIREEAEESLKVDAIIITLSYGYNIGIASKNVSVYRSFE